MASTPRLTTYDLSGMSIILGTALMDGFQDGEACTIEQTSATFSTHVGADGRVTRAKLLDRSATVTIKLMQTSAQNDVLSALWNLDREAPNGAGIVPLYIRDRYGRSLFTAAEAWVQKAPDVTIDKTPTSREWEIGVAYLEQTHGGN